jgi:DNA-directed RNA polymerase subunit RPC12/RpoP
MNTLLSNAVSSIQLGVEDYNTDDPRRKLSAVRNIFAGTLLLFKEKLKQLSPNDTDEVLLKEKLQPSLDANGKLSFVGVGRKTVDVQQIKERFKALGVAVDWQRFEKLHRVRNELEHYFTTESEQVVKEALADAFAVIQSFVSIALGKEPLQLFGHQTWKQLLDESTVYEAQLASCRAEMDKIEWPNAIYNQITEELRCINCSSELIVPNQQAEKILTSHNFRCTSCGGVSDFVSTLLPAIDKAFFAEHYLAMTKGGDIPFATCHECSEETFHYDTGACLLCMAELSDFECTVCGQSLGPEDQDNNGLCGYHRMLAESGD